MPNIKHIIHKHSDEIRLYDDGPKAPDASALTYGEIAVNYATDREALFIKNSQDSIIKFIGEKQVVDIGRHIFNENISGISADISGSSTHVTVGVKQVSGNVSSVTVSENLSDISANTTVTSSTGHVTVGFKQENAKITSLTVSDSDIASHSALTAHTADTIVHVTQTDRDNWVTKDELNDSEEVSAAALNDLNNRLTVLENKISQLETTVNNNKTIIDYLVSKIS